MATYDLSKYDNGEFYDVVSGPENKIKRMAKVKLGLDDLDPDGVASVAGQIKTAMTGNANFTTPNPTLVAIGALIVTALAKIAAQKAAVLAAKQATDDRDAAVTALKVALTQLGSYVENTSGGNSVIIQSAGMGVKGVATPIGQLGQVQNLNVSVGDDDGELDLTWDPIRGAKSYQVQVSVDPITGTSWRDVAPVSKSKKTLTGLSSGARTWTRVRAIAPKEENNGGWSDPSVKTVP
jgi:hypothetical protein